jgi:hypothetical protein
MSDLTITKQRDRLFNLDYLLLRMWLRIAMADEQVMDYLESEANSLCVGLANDPVSRQSIFEDRLSQMQVERRCRQIREIENLYTLFNDLPNPTVLTVIHSAHSSVRDETITDDEYHNFLVFVSSELIPTQTSSALRKSSGAACRMHGADLEEARVAKPIKQERIKVS